MNYYRQSAGIMVDCSIMFKLLSNYNNDVLIHLERIGSIMILNNILFKWFLSVFSQNTSDKFFLCIWDIVFLQGNIVIFKAALGLLKMLTGEIKKQSSIETIMNVFDENSIFYKSRKRLIYYLLILRYNFDIHSINKNRQKLFIQTRNSLVRPSRPKNNSENNKNVMCNEGWPFCSSELSSMPSFNDYIIFKQSYFPILIDNYFNQKKNSGNERKKLNHSFESKNKNKISRDENCEIAKEKELKIFYSLVIERKKHCCFDKYNSRTNVLAKTIHNSFKKIPFNDHSSSYFHFDDIYYPDPLECVTVINEIKQNAIDLQIEDEVKKEWYENPEVFYEIFN